ncbi:hypothetical protein [Yaniella sp.]|uniref:hypothetical protein n=1 Tax=Yaniella sp. TaxID=2773929 RepID=UPI002648681C|nr:hypothetical protein [Yaniella sp.]MDN6358698.1 hypothetical protein [Yaniella sp.]
MNFARANAKKITALTALPFAAALTLSACSGDEETETSFTNSQNGVEMTLTYTAVGEKSSSRPQPTSSNMKLPA